MGLHSLLLPPQISQSNTKTNISVVLTIIAPQDSFKGFRHVGVWSFSSDWQYSTSVCRHTRHWWRGSAACCVHTSTRCSAWCYLRLCFYFQLYFIFLSICQLSEGVDQKLNCHTLNQILSFSWSVTPYYSYHLNRVLWEEDMALTLGPPVKRNSLLLYELFLWTGIRWTI